METKNRGQRLKQSADMAKVEPFAFLNPDNTFSTEPNMLARTSIVDRFLSNFHKPLQRRMLFTTANVVMPASMVIQHMVTGQVFIVGQDREDTDGTSEYERLYVLHLVSNISSAFAEVYEYQRLDPAAMDLTRVLIGQYYIATEFQSTKGEQSSDGGQDVRLLFYSQAGLVDKINDLCEFVYLGKNWEVVQSYYDSGFCSGVAICSNRVIDTYSLVFPQTQYDPFTGEWDFMLSSLVKPFSASLANTNEASPGNNKYAFGNERTIFVKKSVGFKPNFTVGRIVIDAEGWPWKITKLDNYQRSEDTKLTLLKISHPSRLPIILEDYLLPVFTSQPEPQSVTEFDAVTFSVVAVGADTYQWYRNDIAVGTNSNVYGFTTDISDDGSIIRVVSTNSVGEATSNTVVLTVTAIPVPVFTTQPVAQTVEETSTVTFICAATGTTNYQWYKNDIAVGTDSSTYAFTAALADNDATIKVVVSNTTGPTTSDTVVLTVTAAAAAPLPVFTIHPISKTELEANAASFSCFATNATSYQWYLNGTAVGTNSTGYAFTATTVYDGATIYVIASNAEGSTTSTTATLTVTPRSVKG
jgi:hypothetical protein